MQIHQLPAATSIADADMLALDTGSATKYIAAANLLKQQKMLSLSTSQDITVSVDALSTGRVYGIIIASSGAQATCGVPENASYYGYVYSSDANYKKIILYQVGDSSKCWVKNKSGGTWKTWKLATGIYAGSITSRGAMMNTTDTIKVRQAGSTGILQMGCRITGGTYDATDIFCVSSIKPESSFSAVMLNGSNSCIIKIDANGNVSPNSSYTFTSGYLIGQIVFAC